MKDDIQTFDVVVIAPVPEDMFLRSEQHSSACRYAALMIGSATANLHPEVPALMSAAFPLRLFLRAAACSKRSETKLPSMAFTSKNLQLMSRR